MLNKDGERELCYVVIIDDIKEIPGADKVEEAIVGGWHIMVRKNQFQIGEPAIYFEIDSKVPEKAPFEFLASKHYKIKTQKYFKGTVISQGLLMSAKDFNWSIKYNDTIPYIIDDKNEKHFVNDESRFLTKRLNVIYAVTEDNVRKAAPADRYKKMAQRHGKLFSKQPFRWLMRKTWGKKLLFIFFGKKRDKNTWPIWVSKTDEERIENLPYLFTEDNEWIATEKIDGTSTTFTIKRGKRFKKNEFYVCSRNVVMDKPDKTCYYDSNVYIEMSQKYDVENVLNKMLKDFPDAQWITIQGETFGAKIQKRDYSIKNHDFRAFNLIMSNTGRWNTIDMKKTLNAYNIPSVPIINDCYKLPKTLEELRNYVNSEKSKIDNKIKEGIVFRSLDGTRSFKCVSPEYLIKYHG